MTRSGARSLAPPAEWREVGRGGAGPFVTYRSYELPDGSRFRWESRRHRKQHNRLGGGRGSTWWAPGAVAWWIAVLFMVGSACFAAGALPGYDRLVGTEAQGVTFFVGSLFFTAAALAQYLEAVNALPPGEGTGPTRGTHILLWDPRRIDWCATFVQLLGTIAFNVSTFGALVVGDDAISIDHVVWRPDVVGSICFLVASELAFAEVGHRWWSWRPDDVSWWIGALNLGGSVAFGVSAVAAFVVHGTGQALSTELSNLGTFVGALGFLVGALLLLPERARVPTADGS